MRSIRLPVVGCILMQMLGNMVYASAQLFESDRRWIFLIARFINGIGASKLFYQLFQ
jgi:hypothetical protein